MLNIFRCYPIASLHKHNGSRAAHTLFPVVKIVVCLSLAPCFFRKWRIHTFPYETRKKKLRFCFQIWIELNVNKLCQSAISNVDSVIHLVAFFISILHLWTSGRGYGPWNGKVAYYLWVNWRTAMNRKNRMKTESITGAHLSLNGTIGAFVIAFLATANWMR